MKILVINGPNLNNLGKRDRSLYGMETMADIESRVRYKAAELGVDVEFFQSNHEGGIIDYLQQAAGEASALVVNAGALTHYGLSMRDAVTDTGLPFVEVHLSNIHARDEFRRRSVLADIAKGQIAGLGWRGYVYALEYLAATLDSG